jgi:hypothetical protein
VKDNVGIAIDPRKQVVPAENADVVLAHAAIGIGHPKDQRTRDVELLPAPPAIYLEHGSSSFARRIARGFILQTPGPHDVARRRVYMALLSSVP